jgi:hypothetical protein
MSAKPKGVLRSLLYIAFPSISGLLAVPIVSEIAPADIVAGDLHPLLLTLVAVFYLGLLAAPGYVYSVWRGADIDSLTGRRRLWVQTSLVIALLVSLAALGFTFFAFWPLAAFPLVTALMSGHLLLTISHKS